MRFFVRLSGRPEGAREGRAAETEAIKAEVVPVRRDPGQLQDAGRGGGGPPNGGPRVVKSGAAAARALCGRASDEGHLHPRPSQILAVDYTKSNQWTGRKAFGGRSLHWLDPDGQVENPYQSVMKIIGKVLAVYDDDNLIPVFGFGNSTTLDRSIFPCV
jgi:hypothetical protein